MWPMPKYVFNSYLFTEVSALPRSPRSFMLFLEENTIGFCCGRIADVFRYFAIRNMMGQQRGIWWGISMNLESLLTTSKGELCLGILTLLSIVHNIIPRYTVYHSISKKMFEHVVWNHAAVPKQYETNLEVTIHMISAVVWHCLGVCFINQGWLKKSGLTLLMKA